MRTFLNLSLQLFCLFVFASANAAWSQDLDKGERALLMISKFANDICNKPDLKGKARSIETEGKAKAEVSKLIKQLAEIKVEGAAKFGNAEYEGLLQRDLLPALQDSTKCKQKIYDDLKDRFLPKPSSSIGTPVTGPPKSASKLNFSSIRNEDSVAHF